MTCARCGDEVSNAFRVGDEWQCKSCLWEQGLPVPRYVDDEAARYYHESGGR